MNVLSLFDGISCGRVALERAGANVEKYFASEIDTKAIHIAKKNYPDMVPLGDITYWESWIDRLPKIDLVMGGSPCFVAGTKIITDNGYKNIEDIVIGDMVLSHDLKYHPVTAVGGEEKEIWKVKASGLLETETTENHPYLARTLSREQNVEDFIPVGKLTKSHYVGIPIIQSSENPFNLTKDDCIEIGKFLKYVSTIEDFNLNDFCNNQYFGFCGTCLDERQTQIQNDGVNKLTLIYTEINVSTTLLKKLCFDDFGNQCITNHLLNLPGRLLDIILYNINDGACFPLIKQETTTFNIHTTNKTFINSVILAVAKVCLAPLTIWENGNITKLELNSTNLSFIVNSIMYVSITNVHNTNKTQHVYNITVADSHTYTANNAIVHNCQGFSSNGKGLNFSDPRSSLFFTMIDIYNYIKKNNNPDVHFFLENVFMKKEWENVITNIVGFEPVKINSELVCGGLRSRNYWADWTITIPQDRGIVLQDILESGLAYKRKADCIQASYDWGSISHSLEKSVNTLVAEPAEPDNTIQSHNRSHRAFEVLDGKMVTYQMLKENKAGVRLSQKAIHNINLPNGWYTFRAFTPRELERLQTLPDYYCDGVKYADIAHAVGNGWTVDVIASAFEDLLKAHPELKK